jgi:DNA mismatch repair protein MutL
MQVEANIIQVLDDVTANKIAAGEVVERPASVVKELVENALDAGADEIKIELQDGGKRLIRVIDNGSGMSRDDAVLALRRHATSKLRSADDLFAIMTLGFRGEALPSISSISRMEIVTRRESDEAGTSVKVAGGEIVDVADAGTPVGTAITVSDLFFNVPARQKFLKTAQTELGHVLELVNRFAVSHSEVNITLFHNDRSVFKSAGSGKLQDAILTVFGRDAAENVIPIYGRNGPYEVHGFVSRPSFSKPNRSGQMFYVNRRFVRNRNLIHALDDAYKGILLQGRFPLFVGFVEVDPSLVDVNVHPTKIEVKFVREWEAHNLVSTAVRDALSSSAVSPTNMDSLPMASPPLPIRRPEFDMRTRMLNPPAANDQELDAFRGALASRLDRDIQTIIPREVQVQPEPNMPDDIPPITDESPLGNLLDGAVVLVQARNMYIVAQSPRGILLIDQHIAHERILFERLMQAHGPEHMQRLMIPLTLVLSRRESMVLETKLADLKELGFEIEPFGKDTFVVRAVPTLVAEKNYERVIRDAIAELTEMTVSRHRLVHREGLLTTASCKMAVKAGERLSMDEMMLLVEQLSRTSNPYLCPHGRPIVVCISNRELDKMFGRA